MDDPKDLAERLARLEARLEAIEQRLAMPLPAAPVNPSPAPASAAAAMVAPAPAPRASAHTPAPWPPKAPPPPPAGFTRAPADDDGTGASRLMAWGAAIAFLLASVYLLRIVYDAGWLTPPRQVTLATLGGFALIATGLLVSRIDRAYAAYLPAAGTVVLYLTAYVAHLHYGMIERGAAFAAIGATSVLALWLGRLFNHSVFAVLATVGTYVFPLWIPHGDIAIADLIAYYAVWGLVFALASLVDERRTGYVLSMFFSLISFQVAWRLNGSEADWQEVAIFQCYQFVLSAATAIAFSVTHRKPMDAATAVVHGVALFYFYVLEYALLRRYAPDIVGHVALASAVFVLAGYGVAHRVLPAAQRVAGATLASSYCAMVTAHVLVFEWLPGDWLPWAALLAPLAGLAFTPVFRDTPQALAPIRLVSLAVFAAGFLAALQDSGSHRVPLGDAVLFAYAAALYIGYVLLRGRDAPEGTHAALLYAGHVSAMLAFARALDTGFGISLAWGLLALAVLAIALSLRDRALGRSSLLVFGVSAAKVLVVDLQGANSLLRVLSLVVVGISLYAGGWLYQRMFRESPNVDPENQP